MNKLSDNKKCLTELQSSLSSLKALLSHEITPDKKSSADQTTFDFYMMHRDEICKVAEQLNISHPKIFHAVLSLDKVEKIIRELDINFDPTLLSDAKETIKQTQIILSAYTSPVLLSEKSAYQEPRFLSVSLSNTNTQTQIKQIFLQAQENLKKKFGFSKSVLSTETTEEFNSIIIRNPTLTNDFIIEFNDLNSFLRLLNIFWRFSLDLDSDIRPYVQLHVKPKLSKNIEEIANKLFQYRHLLSYDGISMDSLLLRLIWWMDKTAPLQNDKSWYIYHLFSGSKKPHSFPYHLLYYKYDNYKLESVLVPSSKSQILYLEEEYIENLLLSNDFETIEEQLLENHKNNNSSNPNAIEHIYNKVNTPLSPGLFIFIVLKNKTEYDIVNALNTVQFPDRVYNRMRFISGEEYEFLCEKYENLTKIELSLPEKTLNLLTLSSSFTIPKSNEQNLEDFRESVHLNIKDYVDDSYLGLILDLLSIVYGIYNSDVDTIKRYVNRLSDKKNLIWSISYFIENVQKRYNNFNLNNSEVNKYIDDTEEIMEKEISVHEMFFKKWVTDNVTSENVNVSKLHEISKLINISDNDFKEMKLVIIEYSKKVKVLVSTQLEYKRNISSALQYFDTYISLETWLLNYSTKSQYVQGKIRIILDFLSGEYKRVDENVFVEYQKFFKSFIEPVEFNLSYLNELKDLLEELILIYSINWDQRKSNSVSDIQNFHNIEFKLIAENYIVDMFSKICKVYNVTENVDIQLIHWNLCKKILDAYDNLLINEKAQSCEINLLEVKHQVNDWITRGYSNTHPNKTTLFIEETTIIINKLQNQVDDNLSQINRLIGECKKYYSTGNDVRNDFWTQLDKCIFPFPMLTDIFV